MFPYQDCKTDFEVLTKVVEQDPPTLPQDKDFSLEFRQFVSCCLIKDQKLRPKYVKLQNEPFITKYEVMNIDVGQWFRKAIEQADAVAANRSAARYVAWLVLFLYFAIVCVCVFSFLFVDLQCPKIH